MRLIASFVVVLLFASSAFAQCNITGDFDLSFETSGLAFPGGLNTTGWTVLDQNNAFFAADAYPNGTALAFPFPIVTTQPSDGNFSLAMALDGDQGAVSAVSRVINNTDVGDFDYSVTFDYIVSNTFFSTSTSQRSLFVGILETGQNATVFEVPAGLNSSSAMIDDAGQFSTIFGPVALDSFTLEFSTFVGQDFSGPGVAQIDNIQIDCIRSSATPSVSVSPSSSPSASESPSRSPSASVSPSQSPSVSPSLTPSPSVSPSLTPSPSVSPSLTPSPSVSVTPCPASCSFLSSDLAVLPTDPGVCSSNVDNLLPETPVVNDPCLISFALSVSGLPAGAFDLGNTTITYTLTATNDPNNFIDCPFTVSVIDVEEPQLFCPATQTVEPNFCAIVLPTFIVTDNCLDDLVIIEEQTPPVDSVGVNSFNITASDTANEVDCQYAITVPDAFAFPNCPADTIVLVNDPQQCTAFLNVQPEVGFFDPDECGNNSTLFTNFDAEGFEYPVGTTTYLAIANNNGIGSQCTFDIEVDDIENPTIICPDNVFVSTESASGTNVNYPDPIITDNCPTTFTASTDSGGLFAIGDTIVTLTASDGTNTGVCTFVVSVTRIITSASPSETPVFVPSPTLTNAPSGGFSANSASRTPLPGSASRTPSRSNNPSTNLGSSTTSSPSRAASSSPTRTPSPSRIVQSAAASASETPSFVPNSSSPSAVFSVSSSVLASVSPAAPSQSSTPLEIGNSNSPSPFVASASPTRTPDEQILLFTQSGRSALVEMNAPCENTSCTDEEINFYLLAFADELGVSSSDIQVVSAVGHDIVFIVCDSEDIADVCNDINRGNAGSSFDGVFIEQVNFDAECDNFFVIVPNSSSSDATTLIMSAFVSIFAILTLF